MPFSWMHTGFTELPAPAKINLHLRVGPCRPDGFHPLLTWMTTVGLLDILKFSDAAEDKMTCDDPSLPCDGRNLVMKALLSLGGGRRLAPAASALGMGADADAARFLHVHLAKSIPSGGGLGGGSSDAATTLLAVNQIRNLNRDIDHLSDIAATLGSDVPFFLHGPSSICRGRGESVRPIASPSKARWTVLILAEISMPTPAVYRRFDEMGLGSDVEQEPDWDQWCELPSQDLLTKLVNDLEPPAFELRPDLAMLRSEIETIAGRPVRMSGSGSSLFTLYDEQLDAVEAAKRITRNLDTRAIAIEMTPAL